MNVKRRFIDMPFGQIHYRQAGVADAPKHMLLHASPGSSKQLELLIDELSQSFLVVAPDTLGNGDSTPPIQEQPEIADYGQRCSHLQKRSDGRGCTSTGHTLVPVLPLGWH